MFFSLRSRMRVLVFAFLSGTLLVEGIAMIGRGNMIMGDLWIVLGVLMLIIAYAFAREQQYVWVVAWAYNHVDTNDEFYCSSPETGVAFMKANSRWRDGENWCWKMWREPIDTHMFDIPRGYDWKFQHYTRDGEPIDSIHEYLKSV